MFGNAEICAPLASSLPTAMIDTFAHHLLHVKSVIHQSSRVQPGYESVGAIGDLMIPSELELVVLESVRTA